MKLSNINPFLRFAGQVTYSAKSRPVFVRDCRFFYILDGVGEILIGNDTFELKKNTVFYCCGGTDYNIKAIQPLRLYSLNFDLTQQKSEFTVTFPPIETGGDEKSIPLDLCDISDSPFLNSYFFLENGTEFKNSLSEIVQEYAEQRNYFRENCSAVLKKLLIGLHRANAEKAGNTSDIIRKVIEYIRQNYRENLQNSELAEIAGYHEYYLNRVFVKHTGTSMHKYILNLRMSEGERLLLNTDMPVSEISARTGFNSATHFSTYFKKEMKMSPIEYRNKFKNKI